MVIKILLSILLFGVVIVVASKLPQTTPPLQTSQQYLPWQIEATPDDSIRVFGLTLDHTTLQQAEELLGTSATISMFVAATGEYRTEAFFDKVILGGFPARLVTVLAVSQSQQAAMFKRGSRISNLGSGRKKVTLAADDHKAVYVTSISSITYLTPTRLDAELLRKRFGEPSQWHAETGTGITHWMYPHWGLDIALAENGTAILQYVAPGRFAELTAGLRTEIAQEAPSR